MYDRWKVLRKLSDAAGQLDITLRNLPFFVEGLLGRLGIIENPKTVVPFIVTNSYQFTGITIASYPVIDFNYLEFLLAGATSKAVQAQRNTITVEDADSYIRGNKPTGPELARLIRKPIFVDALPEGRRQLSLRRIGPYNIHLPRYHLEV